MFNSKDELLTQWNFETASTQKLFAVLTDACLEFPDNPNHMPIGRIASHIINSARFMLNRTGEGPEGLCAKRDIPTTAVGLQEEYRSTVDMISKCIETDWTDETLRKIVTITPYLNVPLDNAMYLVLRHEIHHRGQLTILLRQFGLEIPGVMGPAKEEWEKLGIPFPGY